MEVRALRTQGWSISAIARHLGVTRLPVRCYLNGERTPGERVRAAADPFEGFVEYVRVRLAADPHLWAMQRHGVAGDAIDPVLEPGERPEHLVAQLARLHGLLDLAWTDDTAVLHARVTRTPDRDVVLTPAEEQAYQRTVDRLNRMWADGSAIDRFLY